MARCGVSHPGLFDPKAFHLSYIVEIPIETVFVGGGGCWARGRERGAVQLKAGI